MQRRENEGGGFPGDQPQYAQQKGEGTGHRGFGVAAIALFLLAPHAIAQCGISNAKIIEWGWGTPSPVYVQQHVAEMEKLPFDGLVLTLTANGLHDLSMRPDRQHASAGRADGGKWSRREE